MIISRTPRRGGAAGAGTCGIAGVWVGSEPIDDRKSAKPVRPAGTPVLVLGATEGQGGAVAEAMMRAGRPVRAFVRGPGSVEARCRPDLGSFVGLVLRDPRSFAGHRIELASDAPTPAQMCQALWNAPAGRVRRRETQMPAVRRAAQTDRYVGFLGGRQTR